MTVICTDGETVACDDCCTDDFISPVKKLFRLNDGRVAGICGHYGLGLKMLRVLNGEIKAEEFKKVWLDKDDDGAELLVVGRKRRKTQAWVVESSYMEEMEMCIPFAIGSGASFAIAALDAGYNSKKAVEFAIKRDPYCGGKVEVWPIQKE